MDREPRLVIGPVQSLYSSVELQLGPTHGYDATDRDGEIVTIRLDESPTSHGDLTLVTSWTGP